MQPNITTASDPAVTSSASTSAASTESTTSTPSSSKRLSVILGVALGVILVSAAIGAIVVYRKYIKRPSVSPSGFSLKETNADGSPDDPYKAEIGHQHMFNYKADVSDDNDPQHRSHQSPHSASRGRLHGIGRTNNGPYRSPQQLSVSAEDAARGRNVQEGPYGAQRYSQHQHPHAIVHGPPERPDSSTGEEIYRARPISLHPHAYIEGPVTEDDFLECYYGPELMSSSIPSNTTPRYTESLPHYTRKPSRDRPKANRKKMTTIQ
ncbi:hypothetical protein BGZ54_009770 [Gamsiella multidivaricata]|nr:hypothetical protein BGZ54_009770 [Gamsiella multidivaricata]